MNVPCPECKHILIDLGNGKSFYCAFCKRGWRFPRDKETLEKNTDFKWSRYKW